MFCFVSDLRAVGVAWQVCSWRRRKDCQGISHPLQFGSNLSLNAGHCTHFPGRSKQSKAADSSVQCVESILCV